MLHLYEVIELERFRVRAEGLTWIVRLGESGGVRGSCCRGFGFTVQVDKRNRRVVRDAAEVWSFELNSRYGRSLADFLLQRVTSVALLEFSKRRSSIGERL